MGLSSFQTQITCGMVEVCHECPLISTVDERDRKLIEHIAKLNNERSEKAHTIGIVYGAFHMRRAMAFLMQKLNYRVSKAEWVKVFDL